MSRLGVPIMTVVPNTPEARSQLHTRQAKEIGEKKHRIVTYFSSSYFRYEGRPRMSKINERSFSEKKKELLSRARQKVIR